MAQFYVLVMIATAFLCSATVRLVKDRFPHPCDVLILSTYYYAVPLAIFAHISINYRGMIFLTAAAADPGLAETSMWFVVAALASLQLGRLAGTAMGPPKFALFFSVTERSTVRTGLFYLGLLSLFPLGIFLFGVREFLQGYATESFTISAATGNALIYTAIESLGLTIAFTLIIAQVFGKLSLKVFILLSLLCMLGVFAVRVKRLEIVSALIPLAVILLSRRSSFNIPTSRLIIGGIVLVMLVVVSAVRVSDTVDPATLGFYALSEGVYAGHAQPGILERIETDTLDYEYGVRFITSVFGFIPRFLWEGKDDMVYAGNAALQGVSPLGATTFLAEVILQGGYVAVGIVYGLLGWGFERLKKFELVWDQAMRTGIIPLRFGAYLVAIAMFIPHFRDGIIPSVKIALQGIVFFILLVGPGSFPAARLAIGKRAFARQH